MLACCADARATVTVRCATLETMSGSESAVAVMSTIRLAGGLSGRESGITDIAAETASMTGVAVAAAVAIAGISGVEVVAVVVATQPTYSVTALATLELPTFAHAMVMPVASWIWVQTAVVAGVLMRFSGWVVAGATADGICHCRPMHLC